MKQTRKLLEIQNLSINLQTSRGIAKVVDGVSFEIREGEIFGLVGESGSGKTMTALSIVRLLPPSARIVNGSIKFEGQELLEKNQSEMQLIRGRNIGMIFQDSAASLNPVMKVGDQLIETILTHNKVSLKKAEEIAIRLLKNVGIADVNVRLNQYPFQLSGGLKQRIMMALALAGNPKLLIADEPTTSLDVTIQWQILSLIRKIREETRMAVMLITHNLGIVAMLCDRAAIMYAGKIVETADVQTLFSNPLHPYTRMLISCIPRIEVKPERLTVIEGEVPDLLSPPTGCRFHPRCPIAREICSIIQPKLLFNSETHAVSCLAYESEYGWSNTP